MIIARRGFVIRISLVNAYIAGVMAALGVFAVRGMVEGARASPAFHPDPVATGFIVATLVMIAIALDGVVFMRARDDMIEVTGLFRRTRLRRSACRCVVRQYGRLRTASYGLEITDGTTRRGMAYYWMWGGLLAARAAERVERSLLVDESG